MRETLSFIVIAFLSSLPVSLPVLIGGGIALAVIILVAALLLFRSSGKGKGAKAGTSQGAMGWQQQGQPDAMVQGGWNQQGVGNPADNQWAQQQQGAAGWNGQQQDPNAWAAQQQQPAANAWSAQQQPGADSWGAQNPSQQPAANAWGQPAGNQWGNQGSPQSPQAPAQSANSWGAAGTPAPGSNQASGQGWSSPMSPQAQADQWGQPQQQMQQPGAASWGGSPASPGNPGNPGSPASQQAPTAFGGNNAAPAWAQPAQSSQPAQTSQQLDQWGQPVPVQQQQPGNIWGMQGQGQGQQGQQPAPTAYGANPAPVWGQPAPAAQQPAPAQQGWGQPAPGGTPGTPAWQQPNQGGFGAPPGVFEGDKTMVRPNTGPQGDVGMVRVEEGKEPGKIYEVRKDSLSIGRSRESDIFLEDLAVSRLHASIVNMGNGSYALKDEGSANGTKVNGQLVNKYQTYPLQEGDRIQLGQTVLVFTRR
ncbi:MAG: FHA domain-containing protein [Ktedonobacteraceae bacterium]